jgi:hypothetical protein
MGRAQNKAIVYFKKQKNTFYGVILSEGLLNLRGVMSPNNTRFNGANAPQPFDTTVPNGTGSLDLFYLRSFGRTHNIERKKEFSLTS